MISLFLVSSFINCLTVPNLQIEGNTIFNENSSISFDGKDYSIDPVGEAAQELIITGGLEEWVKKNL